MEKKDLKWYEAPAMDLINVNVEGQLLESSPFRPGDGGGTGNITDIDDGFGS